MAGSSQLAHRWTTLATVVGVAALGLTVLTGCGGGGGAKWSDSTVQTAVRGCTAGGTSKKVCECVLPYFEKNFSADEANVLNNVSDASVLTDSQKQRLQKAIAEAQKAGCAAGS